MGNTRYELYYHIVFATKRRLPLIDADALDALRSVVGVKSKELGFLSHRVNGYLDHVHMLLTIPPAIAIARVLKHIKGVSSRMVTNLKWQEGYWVSGVERRNFELIAKYIENQEADHKSGATEEWESGITEL